jgi:hypothetical protein
MERVVCPTALEAFCIRENEDVKRLQGPAQAHTGSSGDAKNMP